MLSFTTTTILHHKRRIHPLTKCTSLAQQSQTYYIMSQYSRVKHSTALTCCVELFWWCCGDELRLIAAAGDSAANVGCPCRILHSDCLEHCATLIEPSHIKLVASVHRPEADLHMSTLCVHQNVASIHYGCSLLWSSATSNHQTGSGHHMMLSNTHNKGCLLTSKRTPQIEVVPWRVLHNDHPYTLRIGKRMRIQASLHAG